MEEIENLKDETQERVETDKRELISRMRSFSSNLSFWAEEFESGRKVADAIGVGETAIRIGMLIARIQTGQSVLDALNLCDSTAPAAKSQEAPPEKPRRAAG